MKVYEIFFREKAINHAVWAIITLVWILFFSFYNITGHASTFETGGNITSNLYYYSEKNEFQAFENALKLDLEWRGEDNLSARFIARGGYELFENNLNLNIVEGYIDFFTDNSDWRIGKQLIFWGKADGFSPTDNINPDNYYILSQELEDLRQAIFAIRSDIYLDKGILQLVYSPEIAVDKYPGLTLSLPESIGGQNWSNHTLAVKYDWIKQKTDYSVSLYHGWASVMNPLPLPSLQTNRMTVLGFDFSTVIGQTVLKGEMAYKAYQNLDANLELSLETSYSPKENWNIAGMVFRKGPGFPVLLPQVSQIDTSWGIGGRIEWIPKDYHTIEGFFTYNFENKDAMLNLSYTWDYSDQIDLKVFYTAFSGETGDFAMMSDRDRIGIGLQYSF